MPDCTIHRRADKPYSEVIGRPVKEGVIFMASMAGVALIVLLLPLAASVFVLVVTWRIMKATESMAATLTYIADSLARER